MEPNVRPFKGLIIPPPTETCGNCRYGKLIQIGAVECRGVPPTPVVMGARQNVAGQAEMAIELLRPRMASVEAGCALWRAKGLDMVETAGIG